MRFTNRLAAETSPYLLQHAHNPVDWYPWGSEAIQRAKSEDRPIFLSVGYSTCYWCHVMERQCFENEAIAAEMNRRFVNIKVDREERPDVDQLYMTAVQILTRQGGWPMSVFLTPDLQPFFAGTYFPPRDSYGRPGFSRVLEAVDDAYRNRRGEVMASAEQVVAILQRLSRPPRPAKPIHFDRPLIHEMIVQSTADFDQQNGGFGSAPKFPRQTLLELILVYLRVNPDKKLAAMIGKSLDAMARGGIRDHLGGAFHRYSTDAHWLVPHFEIMLYDNAMLLWIYSEAHRQTGQASYAAVARGIADFVLEEMTDSSGGFFTALDAEVDGQEGANYLWTRQEAADALAGNSDADRFLRVYGLDAGPNFADPHHGNGMPEKNVLFQAEPIDESDARLAEMRKILLAARRRRKGPMLDRKILTSWNALMIRGLAHAGAILGEARYTQAAQKAADFLLAHHRDPDGGLLRGRAGGAGFLDDYAFLIQALLALGRRGDAEALANIMIERFSDSAEGGFFFTDGRGADLIVRQMIGADSPLPSGNAVAAMALLELDHAQAAGNVIAAFAETIQNSPESSSAMLQAAFLYVQDKGDLEIAAADGETRPPTPRELAGRAVEISTSWQSASQLRVTCRMLEGFHLNRPDAAEAPTRLTVSGVEIESVQYPPGELGGTFDILLKLKSAPKGDFQIVLSYQACDASVCLPIVVQRVEVSRD